MPSLMLIDETCERHVYPLGKATLMVGRAESSTIQLPSDTISTDHASIVYDNNEFVIRDNGSVNGTYVNGEQVSRRVLKDKDIVRFGEYLFLVDLEDQNVSLEPSPTVPEIKTSTPQPRYRAVVDLGIAKERARLPVRKSALQLMLTDPVKKVLNKNSKKSSASMFASLSTIFATVALSVGATVIVMTCLLPLTAREAIVQTAGFQQLPFQSFARSFMVKEEGVFSNKILIQEGTPFGTEMVVKQPTRFSGKLNLKETPKDPFRMKILVEQGKQNKNSVIDQVLEISVEGRSFDLFSTILQPGVYSIQCQSQGGPSGTGIPAVLVIDSKS